MQARICTDDQCLTIQPLMTCGLCKHATEPLPTLPLALLGVDGTVQLHFTPTDNYGLRIDTEHLHKMITLNTKDLVQNSQPPLRGLLAASGPMIMNSLASAATLIATTNTPHWSGWTLFLLETLEKHTTPDTYQQILRDLSEMLARHIFKTLVSADSP